MKNQIIIFLLLIIGSAVSAQDYNLNTTKSTLKWTGKAAFNAYSLSGTLNASSGNLMIKDKKLEKTSIIIDMKSLDTENKDLKKHLRGKDFFGVKKHNKATFRLTSPIDLSKSSTTAKGNLTIKGITKPYSFPLKIIKIGNSYKVSGTLKINRTDFKIYYNSPNYFEGLKQNAIADDFDLKLDLIFER